MIRSLGQEKFAWLPTWPPIFPEFEFAPGKKGKKKKNKRRWNLAEGFRPVWKYSYRKTMNFRWGLITPRNFVSKLPPTNLVFRIFLMRIQKTSKKIKLVWLVEVVVNLVFVGQSVFLICLLLFPAVGCFRNCRGFVLFEQMRLSHCRPILFIVFDWKKRGDLKIFLDFRDHLGMSFAE